MVIHGLRRSRYSGSTQLCISTALRGGGAIINVRVNCHVVRVSGMGSWGLRPDWGLLWGTRNGLTNGSVAMNLCSLSNSNSWRIMSRDGAGAVQFSQVKRRRMCGARVNGNGQFLLVHPSTEGRVVGLRELNFNGYKFAIDGYYWRL